MTMIIEAGVLSRAMKSAAAIVKGTNTIPILANARIETKGGELEIVTSNLDTEYRQLVPLVSGSGLSTTIDAKKLSALAGAAASEGAQMSFSLKDSRMTVKSGRSRWVLPALPATDFPLMPSENEASGTVFAGKDLARLISRTAWSTLNEQARPQLSGLFLNAEAGKLRVACTNGHTIVVLDTDTEWPGDAPEVIVPVEFARVLERLSAEAPSVDLVWDQRKIRATIGEVSITGNLVEATFPDYRRVIPEDVENPLSADPETLRKALRRIELIGTEKSRSIVFERGNGVIDLRMSDASSSGEASEQVPASCETGFKTGFNVSYLAGALEAVGGDTVEIHQADSTAVALIRRTVRDGTVCGVMPMRV
jgi:DNA polymerase-3 subunit beta